MYVSNVLRQHDDGPNAVPSMIVEKKLFGVDRRYSDFEVAVVQIEVGRTKQGRHF